MSEKTNLTEALKKYFGFDKFKGDQEQIIQNLSFTFDAALPRR